MSHKVEWTISGIDADYIDLPLADLAGMELAGSLPRLYPIAAGIEESGTGMTTSASVGHSAASSSPSRWRT